MQKRTEINPEPGNWRNGELQTRLTRGQQLSLRLNCGQHVQHVQHVSGRELKVRATGCNLLPG